MKNPLTRLFRSRDKPDRQSTPKDRRSAPPWPSTLAAARRASPSTPARAVQMTAVYAWCARDRGDRCEPPAPCLSVCGRGQRKGAESTRCTDTTRRAQRRDDVVHPPGDDALAPFAVGQLVLPDPAERARPDHWSVSAAAREDAGGSRQPRDAPLRLHGAEWFGRAPPPGGRAAHSRTRIRRDHGLQPHSA